MKLMQVLKHAPVALSGPIAIATASALPLVAHAQDAKALHIRGIAATCANCHGTDGKSVATDAGLVRLAGLDKAYIVEQLNAFRDGRRPATIMHQLAKGYSPAEIDAIAAYFAAQK